MKSPDGTITSDPIKIDSIFRNAWNKIYNGSNNNHETLIKNYLDKYSRFLFQGEPTEIQPITAEGLFQMCKNYPTSKQGMDNLHPEDLRLLPIESLKLLAEILNLVEDGQPWPDSLLHSRAPMLSKNPDKTMDPLEYRILLITPVVYRLWAKYRLQSAQPWITTWELEEMFAGRKG
eukprot:6701899-Karenia_brevis.AAC.1